jgi:hypothetical protein
MPVQFQQTCRLHYINEEQQMAFSLWQNVSEYRFIKQE